MGAAWSSNAQARTIVDLTGTSGIDVLAGGANNDTLTGGAGADNLTGGAGSDIFVFNAVVGASSDSVGAVKDTVDFTTGADFVLIKATNVNTFNVATNVSATAVLELYSADLNANGTLTDSGDVQFTSTNSLGANAGAATTNAQARTIVDLTGTSGSDILAGGANDDRLAGGAGADNLTGGGGVDTFIVESGQSSAIVGGSGNSGTISGYDVVSRLCTLPPTFSICRARPSQWRNTTGPMART